MNNVDLLRLVRKFSLSSRETFVSALRLLRALFFGIAAKAKEVSGVRERSAAQRSVALRRAEAVAFCTQRNQVSFSKGSKEPSSCSA